MHMAATSISYFLGSSMFSTKIYSWLFSAFMDVSGVHLKKDPSGIQKLNHRMACVERDFQDQLVPDPSHGQGCHPLNQSAQGPS